MLGDTVGEADEFFFVNLSSVTNAVLTDNRGLGVIVNDDFQVFLPGDVNQDVHVTDADSLFVNQVLVGLRSYVVTGVLPGLHSSNQTTAVTIYGIGFPTNEVPTVRIGTPVNLTLSSVVVSNREQITATVPASGGLGTGTVNVIYATTKGVI